MIQTIAAWTTSDTKVHTEYVKALKHDLFLMLKEVSENEVGSRRIVESLTPERIQVISDTLGKIKKEMESPTQFDVVAAD